MYFNKNSSRWAYVLTLFSIPTASHLHWESHQFKRCKASRFHPSMNQRKPIGYSVISKPRLYGLWYNFWTAWLRQHGRIHVGRKWYKCCLLPCRRGLINYKIRRLRLILSCQTNGPSLDRESASFMHEWLGEGWLSEATKSSLLFNRQLFTQFFSKCPAVNLRLLVECN